MRATLDHCSALVLNADFRPLSYFPLSLWSWREAIKAVFKRWGPSITIPQRKEARAKALFELARDVQ